MRKHLFIGGTMLIALLAFEIFNFDTTKYALNSLMGDVRFLGLQWATILAVAFCAIDFAGLARLFTPERGEEEPKEVWYLMGAWLLGATMNAMMTWWAVSLTLLNHNFGNEVLSRDQLLTIVPIFVAVLVWLTRILFIGSISVAGERLLWGEEPGTARGSGARKDSARQRTPRRAAPQPQSAAPRRPNRARPKPKPKTRTTRRPNPATASPADEALRGEISPRQRPVRAAQNRSSRVRQRPPRWRSRSSGQQRSGAD
jgi:hypothetical protein